MFKSEKIERHTLTCPYCNVILRTKTEKENEFSPLYENDDFGFRHSFKFKPVVNNIPTCENCKRQFEVKVNLNDVITIEVKEIKR